MIFAIIGILTVLNGYSVEEEEEEDYNGCYSTLKYCIENCNE